MKNFKYFNLSIFLVIFFLIFVFSFEVGAAPVCPTGIEYGQKCSDYGPNYSWCYTSLGSEGCKVEATDPYSSLPGVTDTDINCSNNTWSVTSCNTALYTKCGNSCVLNSGVTLAANCQTGQTNMCDGKCNTNGCNSGYTNCGGNCILTSGVPAAANCQAGHTITCSGLCEAGYCNPGTLYMNGTCTSLGDPSYWTLSGSNIYNNNGSGAGSVGIGITNPNSILHLYKTSGNPELDIQGIAGAGNHWGIYNNIASSENSLRIWGGGDWLTILRNGNIGIGTTNPGTAKLAISGGNLTVSSGIAQISAPDALQDYTLELYQPYSASKPVRLRFHQGSVDWGRIELLGEVFHFKTGNSASEDYIGIRAAGITASSLTLGSSGARTAWPVDSPIFKSPVYGANGDLPVRTSSLTPMPFSMRTVYGPLSYAQPGCPAGTSKWYKLYAELVDNIQSGGDVMFKMDFESGSDVLDFLTGTDTSDVNMGHTYGGSPSYRTYLSGLFQTSNIAHENSQMWLGGTPYCGGATCYGEIRRVELWAYCI